MGVAVGSFTTPIEYASMHRLLLLLAACEPVKSTPIDTSTPIETGEGEGETADTAPAPQYDVTSATNTAILTWRAGAPVFAGYSGTGADERLYLADPLGDGTAAYIYGIPWDVSGAVTIEDAAGVTISTGYLGPDKVGFEGGYLSIPDADADVGDISSAGIGYSLTEPSASGELSELSPFSIAGDTEVGYAGRILRLDADLDGDADDAISTQSTYDSEDTHGEIGVFLDIDERAYAWNEADYVIPACTDVRGSSISYGPVDFAVDADGKHLWVACPSSTYRSGVVELYALPLTDTSEPEGGVKNVGGWTVSPDPRGGVWMGSQGGGVVMYATADLETVTTAYPYDTEGDAGGLFGAGPVVLATSTGQVLLAVGAQTRDAEMRIAPLDLPGSFDPGIASPPEGGDDSVSAMYLCDVTILPETADSEFADLATCERYTPPEGVGCVGAVQGITERDGVISVFSSGWLYGSGTGCGAALWTLTL